MQAAHEEAAALRHQYVGTEHLLLALAQETDGASFTVLTALGVEPADLISAVRDLTTQGRADASNAHDLPYTQRAKKVLELAMTEAYELNHSYVGTEHLLLGLVREEKGIGAQVLTKAGLSLDTARRMVIQTVGSTPTARIVRIWRRMSRGWYLGSLPVGKIFAACVAICAGMQLTLGTPPSWTSSQAQLAALPAIVGAMAGSVFLFFRRGNRVLVLLGIGYAVFLLEWRIRGH
jgi:hypothetical protein